MMRSFDTSFKEVMAWESSCLQRRYLHRPLAKRIVILIFYLVLNLGFINGERSLFTLLFFVKFASTKSL